MLIIEYFIRLRYLTSRKKKQKVDEYTIAIGGLASETQAGRASFDEALGLKHNHVMLKNTESTSTLTSFN